MKIWSFFFKSGCSILLLHGTIGYSQIGPQSEISQATAFMIDGKCFDFDGDGDLDLLAISSNNYKVSWYENQGGGNFSTQKVISNTHDVVHGTAGDLDGDGDLDVVTAGQIEDNIMWFENAGNGLFFSAHVVSNTLPGASDVVLKDLDNDNDLDIITGTYTSDQVSWFENDGNGDFGNVQIISTLVNNAYVVWSEDIDNDGDNDVLSASENDDKVALYKNTGTGIFDPQQIIGLLDGVETIHTADLNGDGLKDIVSASREDDQLVWYQNLGSGSFTSHIMISTAIDAPNRVFTFDGDNDGDQDVFVTSDYDNNFCWFSNLGTGTFGPKQIIYTWGGASFSSIDAGDIDGDGLLDAITASFGDDRLMWYKNLGGGNFAPPVEVNDCTNGATSACASDLDNDGDLDVALTSVADGRVSWFENLGYGAFGPHQTISLGLNNPWSVMCADLNLDGLNDVVAAFAAEDLIAWFANEGSGVFGPPQVLSNGADWPHCVHTADLDGDGDIDVLSASDNDNKIAWYENQGAGIFDPEQILSSTTFGARGVTTSDIDGDNDLDVLAVGIDGGNIHYMQNMGGGNFNPAIVAGSAGSGSCAIIAGDLDNDGDPDLLVARETDDKVSVYLNLGAGTFGPAIDVATLVNGPSSVQIADMDSDGKNDIIFGLRHDDEVYWRRNLGSMTFGPKILVSDRTNYLNHLAVGDLDNDGDADLISSSRDDDKLAWYQNYYGSENSIQGQLFYDADQSGTMESDEHGINNIQVILHNNLYQNFTSDNGNFSFNTALGFYSIPYPEFEYWTLTSDSLLYHANITNSITLFDSLNFGYYPDTLISEVQSDLTSEQSICLTQVHFWSQIQNTGTTIAKGIVHLELDNLLGFLGADVAPDSVVGQNIYWHFDSLFYFGESMFDAMIQMPSFLLTLEDMSSILTVYLLDDSDSIIYVSSDTLDQILWCSYDPNDKAVTPQGIGSSGYILANQDLEYLVRFQNTGNYFATDVIITDQLDPDLDWYSIEPIASSHPMTVHIDPGGEAVFEFKNIMLPDSNSNEPESHGFVKYRIKQKPDLPPGTQFTNSASIFFDLNEPVITNGVLNTIYNCDALTMSITNNLACQNELIEGELVDIPGNTIWQVDSFYTVTSSNLAWSPDTSGTFQLHMTYSNELCSKDSMLQITIHPTSENTTEHSICDNDSILIHGNYENTSGTYVQTLETVLGCDSLLITNLYVKPSYNFQNIYSICEGDSMLFFSNYVSTAGTYYDTLISVEGCDSIFTNTLIVNQGYSANNNVMLCQGDSLLFNGSYLNSSGTYFESLQTVNGCDSIISLDLTVNPSYNFDTSTEICHGDSIQLFGTYQSTAGTYEEIFQTNSGCDSIFSTELIVNPAYHFVQVFSICNGDSLYIHDHYETVSGIYTELNVTTNGCDSNYTSILEVGSNFELVQNLEICSGDSLFAGGEFQYGDGIFIDSLLTTFGCDSVVTTNLVVNSTPSVLLNEFFEDSICLDYGLITLPPGFPSGGVYSGSGVNAGSFDPMLAGEGLHLLIYSYTSNENCTNSDSTQIYITNCAAAKSFSQIGIIAYPNPTTGLITLEKSNIFDDDIHLNVYDSRTALVLVQVFDGPSVTLDLTNLSDGVFFIELRTQDGIYFEKFIKN